MTKLIINADDLGLNESCTKAIVDAFAKGLITDTTMIANGEAFDEAVAAAMGALNGRVGIHFNLTECEPLTDDIKAFSEFCENDRFHNRINRLGRLSKNARKAVYTELSAQIRSLEDAGITITHADSHHHIHTAPFIAPIVMKVCREHGIKAVRLHRNIGNISPIKKAIKGIFNHILRRNHITTDYFGGMDDISAGLPKGIVEIMVHPDYSASGQLIDKSEKNLPLQKIAGDYSLISYSSLCHQNLA